MNITLTPESEQFTIDCAFPGDHHDAAGGPRIWIERKDNAWVIIIHPDGGEPSHKFTCGDPSLVKGLLSTPEMAVETYSYRGCQLTQPPISGTLFKSTILQKLAEGADHDQG